jgi:hypothetical protein
VPSFKLRVFLIALAASSGGPLNRKGGSDLQTLSLFQKVRWEFVYRCWIMSSHPPLLKAWLFYLLLGQLPPKPTSLSNQYRSSNRISRTAGPSPSCSGQNSRLKNQDSSLSNGASVGFPIGCRRKLARALFIRSFHRTGTPAFGLECLPARHELVSRAGSLRSLNGYESYTFVTLRMWLCGNIAHSGDSIL